MGLQSRAKATFKVLILSRPPSSPLSSPPPSMGRAFCSSCIAGLQLTHILRWNHTITDRLLLLWWMVEEGNERLTCKCIISATLSIVLYYHRRAGWWSVKTRRECWKNTETFICTHIWGKLWQFMVFFIINPAAYICTSTYRDTASEYIYECIFMVEPTNYPFPYFPSTLNGFPCTTFVLTQYYYMGIVPKWVGIAWKAAQVDACVCKVHLHVVHVLVVCRPI